MRISPILLMLLLFGGCASTSALPPAKHLSIKTSSLPPAKVGENYQQQLTAVGGVGPYDWALLSGNLPPGIILTSTGVLSGIPTASGQFSFTVQATDSNSAKIQIQIEWRV